MNADSAAFWLSLAAAPPLTVFVIVFPLTSGGWWKRLVGWALMTAKLGLLLAMATVLFFYWFGPDYPYRDEFRLTAYSFIVLGAYLNTTALLVVKGRVFRDAFRERRAARASGLP